MEAVAGSVFQRKDGRWVAIYKHDGNRKMAYGKTEEAAISKRQELMDEINGTLLINNSDVSDINASSMPLGEWLTEWLNSYVKPRKGISTFTGYEVYINRHIIPAIGDIKLHALTPSVFQEFFNEKSTSGRLDGKPGGMSPKSMENMKFMLSAAMRQAMENELVTKNHVTDVIIKEADKKEAVALCPDEEVRLIAVCNEYENISAFGIVIALRAGLQLGELLALKWNNVDMANKRIYIRQYLNRRFDAADDTDTKSALRFSNLKTGRIIKEHDLSVDFFPEIELYMNKQNDLFGNVPDVVIASYNGGLVDPGNYNKLFKRILMKSGIANANFDILRNTFALRYLERGFAPAELPRVMGCGESSKSIKKYSRIYNKQALYY